MPVTFTIKETGCIPDLFTSMPRAQRTWNKMLKRGWLQAGKFWHHSFLDQHFLGTAARKYGYQPRAGEPGNLRKNFWRSYTGRKQTDMGHRRPLVYSGRSEQLSKRIDVRTHATKRRMVGAGFGASMRGGSGGKVIIHAPALRFRRDSLTGPSPDMVAEVTAVSRGDADATIGRFEGVMGQQIGNLHRQQTTRIAA